jgi:hypothetical protein
VGSAEFAKTGDPNFDGAAKWAAFDSNSGEYFEEHTLVSARFLNASEL